MRSIVGSALERSPVYDRSHVTALEIHSASELAMAARATRTSRANKECARSWVLRSIVGAFDRWILGSSASALNLVSGRSSVGVLNRSSCAIERTVRDLMCTLLNFIPLNHVFMTRTYSTTKH